MSTPAPEPVSYGALRRVIPGDLAHGIPNAEAPNAHLLWSRLWLGTRDGDRLSDDTDRQLAHLRLVADACRQVPETMLTGIRERRRAAAKALAGHDKTLLHLKLTPEWRVVIGHGETSIHETGLTFSPIYGVPIWPGSGLKGAAAAQARARWKDRPELVERVFGSPRPGADTTASRGDVVIFDAVPLTAPQVVIDVLTPHVAPYYDQVNTVNRTSVECPPAEYHSPRPVHFLAVDRTPFHTVLVGPKASVRAVLGLLGEAFANEGIGAKTAAGYGYGTVTDLAEEPG